MTPAGRPVPARAASVRRRLVALLYESVLLAAVTFCASLAFGVVFQQRDALTHRHALAAWIAAVAALYFVWPWTRGGQTLAMKTWRLRLETLAGGSPGIARALVRYAACWLWWLPPLAVHALGRASLSASAVLTALWAAAWALSAGLDPLRRFPHDRLAGTRVVLVPPAPRDTLPAA